jgi:hypothetical protein
MNSIRSKSMNRFLILGLMALGTASSGCVYLAASKKGERVDKVFSTVECLGWGIASLAVTSKIMSERESANEGSSIVGAVAMGATWIPCHLFYEYYGNK